MRHTTDGHDVTGFEQGVVARIGVNLQVTAVVLQEPLRMDTLTCPGEFKDDRGWMLYPLALVILALTGTQIGPQPAGVCGVLAGIAQLHGGVVAMQAWCRQGVRNERRAQDLKQLGTAKLPVIQGGARYRKAVASKNHGLTVQRHVVCKGGRQYLCQQAGVGIALGQWRWLGIGGAHRALAVLGAGVLDAGMLQHNQACGRVLQGFAHLLADGLDAIELGHLLVIKVVLDALARQVLGQCRAALALALVRNLLLDHGRQWQIEYLCEEIGLGAQAFTAGSKLGMTQLQDLLVHGLNGGAVLRMQLDQELLQNCTIIRQYVNVQRG